MRGGREGRAVLLCVLFMKLLLLLTKWAILCERWRVSEQFSIYCGNTPSCLDRGDALLRTDPRSGECPLSEWIEQRLGPLENIVLLFISLLGGNLVMTLAECELAVRYY